MATSKARYLSLLSPLQHRDARLYDALVSLGNDVFALIEELHPSVSSSSTAAGGSEAGQVTGFTATLFPNNLRLTWNPLPGIITYEVRYRADALTNWDTATSLLHTGTTAVDVNPLTIPLVYGTYTFLIRSSNSVGLESLFTSTVTISITLIDLPVVTPTVIDNNVLLRWTTPVSIFTIAYYNIYKDSVLQGIVAGNFSALFETIAGVYEYGIEAVDIVGNVGTRGTASATVNQPPDYELRDVRISLLGGTKVHTFLEGTQLLCNISLTATYQNHFTGPGWTTPQDQIDAGFPVYIQPAELTGSYEEVIDYGTIISNTIISLNWSVLPIDGSVAIVSKIAYSDDNITYSSFVSATSTFASSLRYAKIRFEFTGVDTTSLIYFYNLQITLNVKREIDSGAVDCLAADVTGTPVLFNKTFKDIDSITVTPLATVRLTAVYDFVDIPDPTGFSIYVFNSAGARVDATVSWKSRGIV